MEEYKDIYVQKESSSYW